MRRYNNAKTHRRLLQRLKSVLPGGRCAIVVTDEGLRGSWFRDVSLADQVGACTVTTRRSRCWPRARPTPRGPGSVFETTHRSPGRTRRRRCSDMGAGTTGSMSASEHDLRGRIRSATLGADVERGPATLSFALSHSRGRGSTAPTGPIEAELSSIAPYAAIMPGEGVRFWAVVGKGEGKLRFGPGKGSPYGPTSTRPSARSAFVRNSQVRTRCSGPPARVRRSRRSRQEGSQISIRLTRVAARPSAFSLRVARRRLSPAGRTRLLADSRDRREFPPAAPAPPFPNPPFQPVEKPPVLGARHQCASRARLSRRGKAGPRSPTADRARCPPPRLGHRNRVPCVLRSSPRPRHVPHFTLRTPAPAAEARSPQRRRCHGRCWPGSPRRHHRERKRGRHPQHSAPRSTLPKPAAFPIMPQPAITRAPPPTSPITHGGPPARRSAPPPRSAARHPPRPASLQTSSRRSVTLIGEGASVVR